jgi:hypothetical protein
VFLDANWVESPRETPRPGVPDAPAAHARASPRSSGPAKFTLSNEGGTWLVKTWQPVDSTQVEGSDTSGSSSGVPGPLSDATARDLVTRLLKARRKGAANIIRTLATAKFLTDNGDAWVDGYDNSKYFTKFTIKSVKISGSTAKVVVLESWPDGVGTNTYGLIERNGAVLVDSWLLQ